MRKTKSCQSSPRTSVVCAVGNCPRRRCESGFSLAEILVALGILAIGMAMVAAIFPAAMEYNRSSTNDTTGTLICSNGLDLAELKLTADIVSAAQNTKLQIYADDQRVTHLTREEQRYPTNTDGMRTGFVVMARKRSDGRTFQLVTVSYRKTDKDNTAVLVPIRATISNKNEISGASNLKIGSPLINRDTGEFVYIDSINSNGTRGTVDIGNRSMPGGAGDYYVLVEKSSSGATIAAIRRSPAMRAMSKVTGLRSELKPN